MDGSSEDGSDESLAKILSGGILVSGSKIIALGFGFLTQIVMARLLTQTAYGEVVLALAVLNISGLIATLGLDDGLMQQFPKYEDDRKKARGVVRAGFVISIVSGCITGGMIFLSAPIIAQHVFNESAITPLIRIASAGVPFIVIKNNAVALARGTRDAKTHAIVNQLVQPSSRMLLIGGLVLGGFEAGGAVAGQTGSAIIAGLIAIVLSLRFLPRIRGPSVRMYRSVLTFSIPLIAMQGMGFLNSNIDIYMLGYFLESSRVGNYNIALQLGNLMTAVVATISFLLPPVLTRLNEEEKYQEMLSTYQGLTKWVVMISIPIFTVLFFAPDIVINLLFGKEYSDGTLALRIIAGGKMFAMIAGFNGITLVALGDSRIASYRVFVEVIVNIAANYILIPIFGITGGALALSISSVIGDIFGMSIVYYKYRLHPIDKYIIKPAGIIGAASVVGWGTALLTGLPVWTTILLVGLIYPVVIVRFALEQRDEKLLLLFEDRIGMELTPVRMILNRIQKD